MRASRNTECNDVIHITASRPKMDIWLSLERHSTLAGLVVSVPIVWIWWQITLGVQRQRRR
jgi:hypothetical protein